ncbi:MAG: PDZ domain-containing protein, partial [Ignavibacteriae bacterium]|nr:PDZ domain-containing protein [Ignavibacteriota bacterium]
MKNLVLIFLIILIALTVKSNSSDSLIEQSLNMFDLDLYKGQVETPKLRLGHYSYEFAVDSNSELNQKYNIKHLYKIWHILPHTSADEAGLLIGDTLIYLEGKPIYDSTSRGDDYLEYYTQTKKEGDIIKLSVLRNNELIEIPIKLIAIKISVLKFIDPGIGEIKKDSWLQKKINELGLTDWADSIKKQMAEASVSDYNKIAYSDKPNPWRLNAITYLHRYPMRIGAYSRYIVNDIWDAYNNSEANGGFQNIIGRIAKYNDLEFNAVTIKNKPNNINELNLFLASIQSELDKAYSPVKDSLGYVINELLKLLQNDDNYETELAKTKNETERKRIRNEYEQRLAGVFRKANSVDLKSIIGGIIKLSSLIDKSWLIDFIGKLPLKEFEKNYYVIPGVEGEVLYFWVDGNKKYIIGGKKTNRYTGNFNLIIDVGGDDIYETEPVKYGSFRFIADMQGNDTYLDKNGEGSGLGCID